MIIKILNSSLTYVGEIDNAESFPIRLIHGGRCSAVVKIGANKNNAEFLVKGNYFYAEDDCNHLFLITDQPKTYDEKGETLLITAYDVMWVFAGRVTNTTPETLTFTSQANETVIKNLINAALVSSANADRIISLIEIAEDQGRGSVVSPSFDQTMLDADIQVQLAIDGMGLNGAVDLVNKKWVVDVYEGADRSVGNTEGNPAIDFEIKYDNILSGEERDSNANVKNYGYVLGEDESGNRIIVEYGAVSGIERREFMADGGNESDTTELRNIAKANMVSVEKGFQVNADALHGPFIYGIDFFLGDIVTVAGEAVRLLVVDKVYEAEKVDQLVFTFGQRVVTTESQVQSNTNRIQKLETKQSGGGGAGDVTGPSGAVSGNLPIFSGTTGKLLADSGIAGSALWHSGNLDIESGIWTPTVGGSTSDPTCTYSSRVGRYLKFGPLVMANFLIVLTAISGGGGNALIKGLPSNYKYNTGKVFNVSFSNVTGVTVNQCGGIDNGTLSNIMILTYGDFYQRLQVANVGSSFVCIGTVIYEA